MPCWLPTIVDSAGQGWMFRPSAASTRSRVSFGSGRQYPHVHPDPSWQSLDPHPSAVLHCPAFPIPSHTSSFLPSSRPPFLILFHPRLHWQGYLAGVETSAQARTCVWRPYRRHLGSRGPHGSGCRRAECMRGGKRRPIYRAGRKNRALHGECRRNPRPRRSCEARLLHVRACRAVY